MCPVPTRAVTADLGMLETLTGLIMKLLLPVNSGVVNFRAFHVWVYLGKGVATNALLRGATLPHFLSSERVKCCNRIFYYVFVMLL